MITSAYKVGGGVLVGESVNFVGFHIIYGQFPQNFFDTFPYFALSHIYWPKMGKKDPGAATNGPSRHGTRYPLSPLKYMTFVYKSECVCIV